MSCLHIPALTQLVSRLKKQRDAFAAVLLWYSSACVVPQCVCGTAVLEWYRSACVVPQCLCGTAVRLWYSSACVVPQHSSSTPPFQ